MNLVTSPAPRGAAGVTKRGIPLDSFKECGVLLQQITNQLANTRVRVTEIESKIPQLQEQGVFDAIPTMSWEGRNGSDKRYLRLVFPTENGRRRRVYIGCNPAKIVEALEKIGRTQRLRDLQAERTRITSRTYRAEASLQQALNALEGKPRW